MLVSGAIEMEKAMNAGRRGKTILVIDDEVSVRKLIIRLLGKIYPDWTVEEAADLPEAKQKIMDFRPRLAILDIHLPGGNGMDFCRLIQEHPWLSKTRILMITGYPAAKVRGKAFAQGAYEFLSKPFHVEELAGSIGRLLS